MKQYSELENNFKKFIIEHEKGISIDDMQHHFRKQDGQNIKMADYLIANNKFILEMKSLFSDRETNISDKVNSLVKTGCWAGCDWFGSVHLEELIQKHPDSKRFRYDIMNYAYDNIRNKVIKTANEQISKTKEILKLNDSIGGLVLLNDNVYSHKPEYLSEEILHLLESQKYNNIEFVVYISKLVNKRVDCCILLDSNSKNKNYIKWYMKNILILNWASFNKHAIQF